MLFRLNFFILLILFGCSHTPSPELEKIDLPPQPRAKMDLSTGYRSVFWKATNGSQTHYILGTIHEGIRPVDIGKNVWKAIEKSDVVVVESDINQASRVAVMQRLVWNDAARLKAQIGKRNFRKGRELILRYNPQATTQIIDQFSPMGFYFALSRAKLLNQVRKLPQDRIDTETKKIDEFISQYAKINQKPVVGLETLEESLDDFNRSVDKSFIRSEIRFFYKKPVDMLAYYKKNKVRKVLKDFKRLNSAFIAVLLYERNEKWINKLPSLLKKKNGFIAVGLAHLPGKKGIIHMMRQIGYKVRPIRFKKKENLLSQVKEN